MLPKSIPQCRHTKTNGVRCGSPALRNHSFCYFHSNLRAHQRRASSAEARELPIQLPPLEDAHAIQFALMDIGRAILEDRISDKKAGLLLYLLQTATINLKRMEEDHSEELVRQDYPEAVEEMERLKRDAAQDPEEKREKSLADILLHNLGIHPDDPPSPPVEKKEEEPLWWEIKAGFRQPKLTEEQRKELENRPYPEPDPALDPAVLRKRFFPDLDEDDPRPAKPTATIDDLKGMAEPIIYTENAEARRRETAQWSHGGIPSLK